VDAAGGVLLCHEEAGYCYNNTEWLKYAGKAHVWVYSDGATWQDAYANNRNVLDQVRQR